MEPYKTVRALAAEIGVSPSVVTKKRRKGKPDEQIAAEALAYQAEKERKESEAAGLGAGDRAADALESEAEADRRYAIARADLRELELSQKRGELVNAAEVATAWAAMISAAKSRLWNIGPELCDKLASESNPVRCNELVTEKIRQALADLSRSGA